MLLKIFFMQGILHSFYSNFINVSHHMFPYGTVFTCYCSPCMAVEHLSMCISASYLPSLLKRLQIFCQLKKKKTNDRSFRSHIKWIKEIHSFYLTTALWWIFCYFLLQGYKNSFMFSSISFLYYEFLKVHLLSSRYSFCTLEHLAGRRSVSLLHWFRNYCIYLQSTGNPLSKSYSAVD